MEVRQIAADVNEIVLLPRQGTFVGSDWRRVPDPQAVSREALEAPAEMATQRGYDHIREGKSGYVEFSFQVTAGKTYYM